MSHTLSDRFIKSVKPPVPVSPATTAQADYWDAATPGFGLRVTDKGIKSWTILYRLGSKQVRQTLGRFPGVSLADARRKAADVRERVAKGKDPRLEEDRQRREEEQARADSVAAVAEKYLQSIGTSSTTGPEKRSSKRGRTRRGTILRTGGETKRILKKYVAPAIGNLPMRDVTRRQLVELLGDIADNHGGVMANRTLAQVRRLFGWAIGQDIIDQSPCVGIEKPAQETPRDRLLTDVEINRVWAACDKIGQPYGSFLKFVLLTGVRRAEAGNATRSEIDGEVWVVPARRQKSGVDHAVPLARMATEILESMPKAGAYLFKSTQNDGPMRAFADFKERLDKIIAADGQGAMAPWTVHDLRRVVRSGLSALRIDKDISEKVLGHVPEGLRRTYDRYSYLDEKRAALEAWARRLQSIVDPAPKGNVFELRAAG